MFRIIKSKIKKSAVSSLEIILVIAMFSVMVLGISSTVIYVIRTSATSTYNIKAAQLAEEGLEAVRDMKMDSNSILTNGSYGLSSASGKWVFSGTSETIDTFSRSITIADDSTNTTLPNVISKKITSTVTWNGGLNSYSISTLLTNWQRFKAVTNAYWGHPIRNSTLDITLGTYTMSKMVKVDNYIYGIRAVSGTNNLIVINVTDPLAPTYVTQFSVLGVPYDIAASGNYLYIASGDNNREISVINITNRTAPVYLTAYNANSTPDMYGLTIVGNRLYATRQGNAASDEFEILNITNPAAITKVSGYNVTGNVTAYNSVVIGNYAYVATAGDTTELVVLNITNEATPSLVVNYDIAGSTNDLYYIEPVGTTTLLVADTVTYVRSINITNPAAPTVLSSLALGNRAYKIVVNADNTRAFLATAIGGYEFRVLNISNLSALSLYGGYNEVGTGTWFSLVYDSTTDYIYGAANQVSLELTILKPSATHWLSPTTASTLDITSSMAMIAVTKVGNYLYGVRAVSNTNNLLVINVTDPMAPSYVGAFSVNGTPVDIDSDGAGYIYIASTDDTREITVMSTSNPASPQYVGYYDATGTTDPSMITNGGFSGKMFLGRVGNATTPELTVLNTRTPSAITLYGTYDTPSNVTVYAMDRSNTYYLLAVANNSQELLILNGTNDAALTLTGSLNLSASTFGYRIKAIGTDKAVMTDYATSIYTINLSNMAAPTQSGFTSTSTRANALSVTSDGSAALVGVVAGTYTMETIHISNTIAPTFAWGASYSASSVNDGYYDSANDIYYAVTSNTSGEVLILKANK